MQPVRSKPPEMTKEGQEGNSQPVKFNANNARDVLDEKETRRDKCVAERQKPIPEQQGAVWCATCRLRSQGGLAVHHCRLNVNHGLLQLCSPPPPFWGVA